MRPVRALAAQSPAIVIAIAALVLSLSGGAYAASAISGHHATPAAAASNTFTFHDLTLLNGWKTVTGRGNPGVAVSGNTVRLRGEMSTAGTNALFARLPSGARPAHTLDIVIATGGGQAGLLVILKSGAMFAEAGNSASFSALSGISFTTNS